MKLKIILVFAAFLLAVISGYGQTNLSTQEIMKRIFETAKANDKSAEPYGVWQESTVKKLTDDGELKKQEKRSYRTIWIENRPYEELMTIDDKPLTKKQKDEEEERRKEFIKNVHNKKAEDTPELTWEDLYQKYEFTSLPPEKDAAYVFSFRPKLGKQKERTREEKIFNHLSGNFWADKNFNLIKVEAHLSDSVSFGWGILARVDNLQLHYTQQDFHEIWLPATLHISFKAKIALLRTERQEIDTRFHDPFLRPGAPAQGRTP